MRKRLVEGNSLHLRPSQRKRLARLGALLAAGATAGAAQAATITVTSLGDAPVTDSQCTLREAVNNANGNSDTTGGDCTAGSGSDTIQFQVGLTGTITLLGTQLAITDSATINGPGAGVLTVSGNNANRIFYIYNNTQALAVTISGLTLTQGNNPNGSAVSDKGESVTLSSVTASGNTGDAVRVLAAGSLTLQSSTVTGTVTGRGIHGDHAAAFTMTGSTLSNNTVALKGGGLFLYQTSGAIAIDNSIVSGNSAGSRGGGISLYQTHGPVTITNSQVTGNASANRGGGIHLYKAFEDVTIQNTTISGNTAATRGGGIFFYKQTAGKTLTIMASTISGNSLTGAAIGGGGIFFYKQSGTTIIEDTTISGNTAPRGGGIYDFAVVAGAALFIRNSTINGNTATTDAGNLQVTSFPSVTIANSIIANGTAPLHPDLQTGASNVVVNYSLIEDPTGATFTGANNITGVDPLLGPLANNGGPTLTHLPATGSPVLDAGDPAAIPPPSTDQRGLARVVNGRVDMGSVESNGGVFQFSAATFPVGESGGNATITISRTGGTDPASVNYGTSDGSATQPGDYTTTSGTANFAAGATSAMFNVPITNDVSFEPAESFTVTLSSPSANATLGAPNPAAVNITDDDAALADLAITKSASGGPFTAGTPITFNIGVSNAGPDTATSVVVTDVLPAGTVFNSATPSQGSCSGTTTITCNFGALASSGNATVALTITPTAAGPLSNTATVAAAEADPNPTNSAATANVTVAAAVAVPLFGNLARAMFAILSALAGWFVIRKQGS